MKKTTSGTGNQAFTLVEMLVVLAIIGMLLGLSLPFTSSFGKGLRLKTSTRAVSGILRIARSNAITYRSKYSVVFDVEESAYWIEDQNGTLYEKKHRLSSGVEFKVAGDEKRDPITFEDDRVTFFPTGALEGQNGSISISDHQGTSKNISIIGSTGKISIE